MNNIYFIIAPSGSGKISVCNLLKEKYNITFDEYNTCATAEQVENNDLYIIDPDGIDYFREHYKGKKTPKVIFITADMETRYERMVQRSEGKGNTHLTAVDEALARIKNDIVEFYDYVQDNSKADYTINNIDNLDNAVEKVYNFICSCEGGDEN